MSKIFTPSNRIQLTNVAVVRLKKGNDPLKSLYVKRDIKIK